VEEIGIAFCLGTLSGVLSHYGELYRMNALEILVPMAIGFVAKAMQILFGVNTVCFGNVTAMACFTYFPGIAITLSMVELASRNLVSGTVRMFYSFVRSLKLGFGLAMGSRIMSWIAQTTRSDDIQCINSSRAGAFHVKDYPLLVILMFVPLSIAINIILIGHPRQWFWMSVSSGLGLISTINFIFLATLQIL
jgi:hypothetical protein